MTIQSWRDLVVFIVLMLIVLAVVLGALYGVIVLLNGGT